MRLLTLFFFLEIIFFSCHKKEVNTIGSDYFPKSIGNVWKYSVYDSSLIRDHPNYPRSYEVVITIIGTKVLLDGKIANVWQFQYPWGTEDKYVRETADTIKFYDAASIAIIADLAYPNPFYLIPFNVNETWRNPTDSFSIVNQENIITSQLSFPNSFKIYHLYEGFNTEYDDNYWFKENIGMVKMYYKRINLSVITIQLWQLQHYYLK
jgi:hypothetical protein